MSVAAVPANHDFFLGLGAQLGYSLVIQVALRRFNLKPADVDRAQHEKMLTVAAAALAALLVASQSSLSTASLTGIAVGAALFVWQGNHVHYLRALPAGAEDVEQRVMQTALRLKGAAESAAGLLRTGREFMAVLQGPTAASNGAKHE